MPSCCLAAAIGASQFHPVDLAQPDRADARGRPSMKPVADVAKLRPGAAGW